MKPQFINIGKEYGPVCGHRELPNGRKDAKHLQKVLARALQKAEKIRLSFKGVMVLTPSFADEAFGKLAEQFGLDPLNKLLEFKDVSEYVAQRINYAVDSRLKRREQAAKQKEIA